MPDPMSVNTYGAVSNNSSYDNYAAFKNAIASGQNRLYGDGGIYYFQTKDADQDCCVYLNHRINFENIKLASAGSLTVDSVLKVDLTVDNPNVSVNPWHISDVKVVGGALTSRGVYVVLATHLAMRDNYITMVKSLATGLEVNDWWMGEVTNNLIIGAASYDSASFGIKLNGVVTGVCFTANRVKSFGTGFYGSQLYYSTVDMEAESCDLAYEFSLARTIRAFLGSEYCAKAAIFRAFTGVISANFSNCSATDAVEFAQRSEAPTLGNVATVTDLVVSGTQTNMVNITHGAGEITMPVTISKGVVGLTDILRIFGGGRSPDGTTWQFNVSDTGVVTASEIP